MFLTYSVVGCFAGTFLIAFLAIQKQQRMRQSLRHRELLMRALLPSV